MTSSASTSCRSCGQRACPSRDVRRYFAAEPGERLQILREHRSRVVSDIEELTGALELIDYKIDLYRKRTT